MLDKAAPDFACPPPATAFSLSSLRARGRAVLLPQGQHPSCTTEPELRTSTTPSWPPPVATVVLGISATASSPTKLLRQAGLPFSLVSDPDETACNLYGVMAQNMYGKRVRGIERSTFVIDADGVLRREWRGVKVPGHARKCWTYVKDPLTRPARLPPTAASPRPPWPPDAPRSPRPPATKLFVLDTNVLMHDPTSLFRFEEHDIFVPMMTLEELDSTRRACRKSPATPARPAARSTRSSTPAGRHRRRHQPRRPLVRSWPAAACSCRPKLRHQAPRRAAHRQGRQPDPRGGDAPLRKVRPKRQVILVSKDINMRIKAARWASPRRTTSTTRCSRDTDLLLPAPARSTAPSGKAGKGHPGPGSRKAAPTTLKGPAHRRHAGQRVRLPGRRTACRPG